MAQFTVFKSTDSGAPVLTGQTGKLAALLKACLVDGYGAKTGAGWQIPFSGTNKYAFRSPTGNRFYLSVNDNATGTGIGPSQNEADVYAYETMSAMDVGLKSFTPYGRPSKWRKSATIDATARPWVCLADNRTMYLFIQRGDYASSIWFSMMFGEMYSFVPNDAYNTVFISRPVENNGAAGTSYAPYETFPSIDGFYWQSNYSMNRYLARAWGQGGSSVICGQSHCAFQGGQWGQCQDATYMGMFWYPVGGVVRYTSAGSIVLSALHVHEYGATSNQGAVIRGKYRGVYLWSHGWDKVNSLDTFNVGGKSFLVIKDLVAPHNSSYHLGMMVFETSDTLETN